jgi:hypothetical protein
VDNRFDELAKALAQGVSRREALRRLGGGMAGALLMSLGVGNAWGQAGGGGRPCPNPGEIRCDGVCVNPRTDPDNCGRCGNLCPAGVTCVNGTCGGPTGGCPSGQTRCSGTCVNLATDFFNCGSCRHACAAGQFCSRGSCVNACSNPVDCPSDEDPSKFGCGGNANCACLRTVEGPSQCTLFSQLTGFCTDCRSSSECPRGMVCVVLPICCRDHPTATACTPAC